MEQITTQEAYERIRAHFEPESAQLGRSEDGDSCLYRSRNGRKCAVGCLIDDAILDRPPLYAYSAIDDAFNIDDGMPWETLADELNTCGSIYNLQQYIFPSLPELEALLDGENDEGHRKFEFLVNAQSAHDGAGSTDEFVRRLDALAVKAGLKLVK